MSEQITMFAQEAMGPPWVFAPLEPHAFDFIFADPPWRFVTYSAKGKLQKSAERHYGTMTIDDIKALPVADLGAPKCILWLWTTGPMLAAGHAHDVARAWGFVPKTIMTWVKRTKNGKLCFGTGYLCRETAEPILVCTRGGTPKIARNVRSVIEGLRRGHSQKPEEAFAAAERLMPDARRVELFSRTDRPNWESWGNERNKIPLSGALA